MSTNCVVALVILVFAFILGEIRSTRSLCELGRYDRGDILCEFGRYDKKKNRPRKGTVQLAY